MSAFTNEQFVISLLILSKISHLFLVLYVGFFPPPKGSFKLCSLQAPGNQNVSISNLEFLSPKEAAAF